MISPKDLFCTVDKKKSPMYAGVEFRIVQFGPLKTSVRHPTTGGLLVFKTAWLQADYAQRLRSQSERSYNRNGATFAMSPKNRPRS